MNARRAAILDAALSVLADLGMRGLTHRAVDAAADLPAGSTSYYFRSRSALVEGCLERLLELDLELEMPAVQAADAGDLVDVLAAVVVAMATTERHRTLARFELSLAAAREPGLRGPLRRGGDTIRRLGAHTLATAGVDDPLAAAEELAALIDGLAFTALTRGPDEPAVIRAWARAPIERLLTAVLIPTAR